MARKERLKPEQVIEALNTTSGLVHLGADRLGCSPSTVYRYAERYPAVREAIEHHKGRRLDAAEASLWAAVQRGEAWAVIFYLKTQGKHRGYVERQEVTGTAGGAVRLSFIEFRATEEPDSSAG